MRCLERSRAWRSSRPNWEITRASPARPCWHGGRPSERWTSLLCLLPALGAFCRYHQPDDKGGPRHNIKRINEPLSPALSPLVPRGERESLRARFGGTDEMRTPALLGPIYCVGAGTKGDRREF